MSLAGVAAWDRGNVGTRQSRAKPRGSCFPWRCCPRAGVPRLPTSGGPQGGEHSGARWAAGHPGQNPPHCTERERWGAGGRNRRARPWTSETTTTVMMKVGALACWLSAGSQPLRASSATVHPFVPECRLTSVEVSGTNCDLRQERVQVIRSNVLELRTIRPSLQTPDHSPQGF